MHSRIFLFSKLAGALSFVFVFGFGLCVYFVYRDRGCVWPAVCHLGPWVGGWWGWDGASRLPSVRPLAGSCGFGGRRGVMGSLLAAGCNCN